MNASTEHAHASVAERVARHLGTILTSTGRMPCPACGGDYGPTLALHELETFELGYLPGSPLLAGVCLDCEHIVEPTATPEDQLLW